MVYNPDVSRMVDVSSKHLFSLFFLLEIGESYVAYRFFGLHVLGSLLHVKWSEALGFLRSKRWLFLTQFLDDA